MSENWIILPLLLPLAAAFASLCFRRRESAVVFLLLQLSVAGAILMDTYGGRILASNIGYWSNPFGITLVVDALSAGMLFASSLIFLATVLYSFEEHGDESENPYRLPLIFFLQAGVSLSFLTGDFFNLFVAFEIMLTASYALMTLGRTASGVYHYVLINMLASFLFLFVASMFYGYTGQLNFAALSVLLQNSGSDPLVIALGIAVLIVFGIKAGLFPVYFWLPDSYPLLPASLAALFSGVLTKVGVYALFRMLVTVLPLDLWGVREILLPFSCLTMILGVLGAVSKGTIRGILSYHILSQVGYMVFAVAVGTPAAMAAGIFFTLHNMVVKSSLFLVGGIARSYAKTDELKQMGDLWGIIPFASVLFLIQALSLAGIPPFSGFWGKYLLFFDGLKQEYYLTVAVAVVTSFYTLFSMIKIWKGAFLGERPEHIGRPRASYAKLTGSALILVVPSLFMGFAAEYTIRFVNTAAEQAYQRTAYIQTVSRLEGKGGEERI